MGRSKLPLIIALFSLMVAAGSVFTLVSVRKARSAGTRVVTTSLEDSGSSQTPLPIDPAAIGYRQVAQFPVNLQHPVAVAVDPEDRIYVAGDKCLNRYSPDGRIETSIRLAFDPMCLAIGNRQHISPGQIYVAYEDHVEVFDPNGIKTAIWQRVDNARFCSIGAGEHDLFLADAGNNAVQHFDAMGNLLPPIGGADPEHFAAAQNTVSDRFGLVVGLDDLVYVVNRRECRVEGWNHSGEMEWHWGQASGAVEDFSGRNNPARLALTRDGQFVTAEADPLRVKVYARSGDQAGVVNFVSVVCGPEATGSVTDLATDRRHRILVLDGNARCVRIFAEKEKAAKEKTAKRE